VTSGHAVARGGDTIARLRLIAEDAARRNEAPVLKAQAVKSVLGRAMAAIASDIVGGDQEQPVWVIQVEGAEQFTCLDCSRPPHAKSPRGRFLTLVLNAQSFGRTSFGIGVGCATCARERRSGIAPTGWSPASLDQALTAWRLLVVAAECRLRRVREL
jgi:hypothetical protein